LVPVNTPPASVGVNIALASFTQKTESVVVNEASGLGFTAMFLYAESAQFAFEIKYFIGKMPVVMGENSCALTLVPEKTPPACVGVKVIVGEPIQTSVSDNVKAGFGLLKTVKFWLEESTQNAFETMYFTGKTPTVLGVKKAPETLVPVNIPPLELGVNMVLDSFKQKVVFDDIKKGSGLAFTSMFL
jgi:hypothetical protein